ncbi:putative glutaminase [Aspergillus alliaceus]|uniref:putative glutaminase n=1 Tax=Petromyces alliaceus TaxID=209559 RepID=UPI0012A6C354|nr:uncharacterized protein BDW43DRAFT_293830 [Aspergillus alliaceus]KAB8227495.1 hypothetical protein BDW43DRAFT_293830 [Aspergillus alliaceus]
MPIEECGNLMVLTLAYVRAIGYREWTAKYQELMRPYATWSTTVSTSRSSFIF